MKHSDIGNIGQWLSVFIMLAGIYYLISNRIDIGTILFSSGCLVETLATKIKYYGNEFVKKHKELKEIILYKEENEISKLTSVASCSIFVDPFLHGGINEQYTVSGR